MVSYEFFITALIVVLIPGTGVIFTVSVGLAQGRSASAFAAFGCTLGILPHLLATVFGLAALMRASALAFEMLRYAGAAYLLYLAWATWRDTSGFSVDRCASPKSSIELIVKAFLLNILNPKLTLFFLAFLPQFVQSSAGPAVLQLITLSGVFMAMTFAVFVIYGLLAHLFRTAVIDSPSVQRWLRRGFATVFAGLGIQLALNER